MKSHRPFTDRTGERNHRLTVIEFAGYSSAAKPGRRTRQWLCRCECGKTRVVLERLLKEVRACKACVQQSRLAESRRLHQSKKQKRTEGWQKFRGARRRLFLAIMVGREWDLETIADACETVRNSPDPAADVAMFQCARAQSFGTSSLAMFEGLA